MERILNTKTALAILCAVIALLSVPLPALAQTKAFTITPIVKRGEPSPKGEPFFSCPDCGGRLPGINAFNNRGDLILEATGGGCYSSTYLISGDNRTLLLDYCTQTAIGLLEVGDVSLNNRGQLALTVYSFINNQFDKLRLFLYENGELAQLFADGDATPSGGFFSRAGLLGVHINDNGDIVFEGVSSDPLNNERADIYQYSGGRLRSLVASGSPSPIGGPFWFFRLETTPQINAEGDVLFYSSVLDPLDPLFTVSSGLFMLTPDGAEKIVADGDDLPTGVKVNIAQGSLNDRGDVAFSSNTGNLFFEKQGGVYISSGGQIHKIMSVGDPTPVGGKFASFGKVDEFYQVPRISSNGAVAFKAAIKNGSSASGIFLASPNAMVNVVAAGERVDGGKIASFDTYAMNDIGEIAFVALDKQRRTLGVFKATPVAPAITSIKLKQKRDSLELRVDGSVMITGNSVIEINGVALAALDYPTDYQQDGGTITRTTSRDPRLAQLLQPGQTVQVTVFNPLTNQRSLPIRFTRP